MNIPPIEHVSVKVMRSYDYCHFEVVLGTSNQYTGGAPLTINDADTLRKEAARLADKAVEQYKVAKDAALAREELAGDFWLEQAKAKPDSERSPKEKAIVKYHQDAAFRARFSYDYEDDWESPDYDDDDEYYS